MLQVETGLEREALEDFLHYFVNQSETGLLLLDGESAPSHFPWLRCAEVLERFGLSPAGSWRALLDSLDRGVSTFIRLKAPVDRELYQLVTQLSRRRGLVQLMDPDSLELRTVHFDPEQTRVLLLAAESELPLLEARQPICDRVGMIGRSVWS